MRASVSAGRDSTSCPALWLRTSVVVRSPSSGHDYYQSRINLSPTLTRVLCASRYGFAGRIFERRISRLIRSLTGGNRAKMLPSRPTMLSPASARGLPVARSWIFSSADARDAGFPVVLPLISSGRYSRSRGTAGSKNLLNGSKNRNRDRTEETTLNRESWFLMCMSSCVTTVSTSSRSRSCRRPADRITRRRRGRQAPAPIGDHRRQGKAQHEARCEEDPEEDRDGIQARQEAHAELRVPRVCHEHVRPRGHRRGAGGGSSSTPRGRGRWPQSARTLGGSLALAREMIRPSSPISSGERDPGFPRMYEIAEAPNVSTTRFITDVIARSQAL